MSLPELFGSYLLHDKLAEGTMSEVFLGQTMGPFPRLCAVKRIRPQLAGLTEFRHRFEADAATLVKLIHGNLAQVLEVGMVDDQLFLALELIEGVDHAELVASCATHGPLPTEAALHVVIEMCEATAYLQRRYLEQLRGTGSEETKAPTLGYPADHAWALELMISFDGVVKVVDLGSFGALRIGQQPLANVFRSPGYAAPEVLRKQPLDERSQVFAVGLLLWELLAGRRLVADDPEAYVALVLSGKFAAPFIERKDVPGNIIRLLSKMLSLDPQRRPASLDGIREELVGGLRRVAPGYGSTQLAELLRERCGHRQRQLRKQATEASRRAKTEARPMANGRTLTFGISGDRDRELGEPLKLAIGDRIPNTRYRIVRPLGEGGSAEVFCAQHIDLDRQVAIKILDQKLAAQSQAIAQFRMEARACSRLGHPNIVDVIDFGELPDGRFFYAMELVEGESLAEVLATERIVPAERALAITRQLAKALQAAHDHHIIHRDIKPENIMLSTKDGRGDFVKILDFGVMAFATDTTSESVGTPGYMSPEQVQGELPTPQMDVYGLGITLYEMLAGALPYPGETIDEFSAQQAAGPPPALRSLPRSRDVHPALERTIHRALERDPGARPPSCADFEADLIIAQKEAGVVTAWDDLPPPAPESLQDRRRGSLSLLRPQPAATPELENTAELPGLQRPHFGLWIGGLSAALVVSLLAFMMLREEKKPPTNSPPIAASRPLAPAPRLSNDVLPPALLALITEAGSAANRGHFTRPRGENAYDKLLAFEAKRPHHPSAAKLRERCALTLGSLGARLWDAGFRASARTLYREALLFRPDSPELRRRSLAPDSPASASGSAAQMESRQLMRPTENAAEIAHLVARIQLAVAQGNLIAPPNNNALALLSALKRLDPSGELTARVQGEMAKTLHSKAATLWDQGRREPARELYKRLAELDPKDGLAKKRSTDLRKRPGGRNAIATRTARQPEPPLAPSGLSGDSMGCRKLVAEGHRLLEAGKTTAAAQRFVAARQADPRSARASAGLAMAHLAAGRYIRAVELAEQASRLDRRLVQARIVLGDAYFQLGRRQDALVAWRDALKLAPSHLSVRRRIERIGGTLAPMQ